MAERKADGTCDRNIKIAHKNAVSQNPEWNGIIVNYNQTRISQAIDNILQERNHTFI